MIYVNSEKGKVDIFSTVEGRCNDRNVDEIEDSISRKNYIICFTERSGSTMLCSLLKKTGLLGIPDEYVNPRGVMQMYLRQYPASSIFEYFALLRRYQVTSNSIFGMKTCFPDFEPLLKHRITSQILEPVRFIYLVRKDIVLQAISAYVARQSGIWHVMDRQITEPECKYDESAILKLIDQLILERLQWERFFTLYSIEPLRITYEESLEDIDQVIRRILVFLGENPNVQIDIPISDTQKIGGYRNREWAERIRSKFTL